MHPFANIRTVYVCVCVCACACVCVSQCVAHTSRVHDHLAALTGEPEAHLSEADVVADAQPDKTALCKSVAR